MKFLSKIKHRALDNERRIHAIPFGLFRGIKLSLELSYRMQLYLGLFEKEIAPWVERLSADANTVIDIGAGEGEYTLYFLKKTNVKKVLSFEPHPKAQKVLHRNVEINKPLRDCSLVLSPKFVENKNSQYFCTLDSLIPSIETPCFVKIDVEGSEDYVLRGGRDFLRLADMRIVIETHEKATEKACLEMLTEAGYSVKIIPRAWWRAIIPETRAPRIQNQWIIATHMGPDL